MAGRRTSSCSRHARSRRMRRLTRRRYSARGPLRTRRRRRKRGGSSCSCSAAGACRYPTRASTRSRVSSATDFTTDRAALLTTIDRFKKAHDKIEADLDQWFSSLRTQYGGNGIPDHIQAQVDAVFRAPGGAQARQLPQGAPTDATNIARDTKQNLDAAMRGEIVATRDPSPFDAFDTSAAALVGMTFDQYAKSSNQSTQDLANIYTGIRYLRYLDGEKHLVFVTESGMLLPRLENDYSVASLASDARVVIDVLMTGGLLMAVPAA